MGFSLMFAASCRKQDLRELTLHIPEMQNDACVQIVMQALVRGPGIQQGSLLLDPSNRVVRLTYDSLLTADKNFEYLVSRSGFAVNAIPADQKARAALPPAARP
jgi:hypothetical protein